MSFKGFLFCALVAILFSGAEQLSNFDRWSPKEHFCDYFEIRPLVQEEMSFKGFSIFSSGGHFIQCSGTILAILVEGHQKNISMKLF